MSAKMMRLIELKAIQLGLEIHLQKLKRQANGRRVLRQKISRQNALKKQ